MEIRIATGGDRPIYRQIIDQVRQAVATNQLSIGDALPSVRQMAEQLVVNHNTVAKAYADLVRDGVLESRHGRGVFVAQRRAIYSSEERKRRFDQSLTIFLSEVLTLGYSAREIEAEVAQRLGEMVTREMPQ